jgi:hypothetical protein
MPDEILWGKTLSRALETAKAQGKLVLIYFFRST